MKKIISLMLVIVFVFTLSACGNKDTLSNIETSDPKQNPEFIKPEDYAAVLLISINPQFNLYFDETYNVLEVEPNNEDAKSFFNSIRFENKSIESVIGNIIELANNNGFIKDNVTVDFEITEKKEGFNSSDILNKAVFAVQQKATELKIEIKTQIKENNDIKNTEENNSQTQTVQTSKPTTSSKPEKGSSKTETTETSKPTHTHSYSAATCTTPQKCSCGETNGSALGHKWQEATCKAPKTCSVCKATEGKEIEHKYKDGKCEYCDKSEYLNPKQHLKIGYDYEYVAKKYYVYNGQDIYAPGFQFCNDGGYGDSDYYCIKIEAMFTSVPDDNIKNRPPVNYNGKNYYRCGAGQSPTHLELTDSEIIVSQYSMKIKAVLLADGTIKITESTESDYPVGTLFSTEWSMLN